MHTTTLQAPVATLRGALAALLLWAAPVSAQSLADALAQGYEASGLVEQNRALLRAADEDVAQVVAALRPIVTWSAQATSSLRYGPAQTLFGAGANELSSDLTGSIGLSASLTL